jgi:hypothetical protein
VRIVELQLDGGGKPITGASLRQLPISAMEQVAASALRTDGHAHVAVWTHDGLKQLLKDAPEPQPSDLKFPGPDLVVLYGQENGQVMYQVKHSPPIDWSKGQAITDEFLRLVGDAYDSAIQRGESPAKSIAEATGASQKTVQSWVYQGRLKGVIAPAQGKGRIK